MTPAMKEQAEAKQRHPGMVILLRMDDFFETFGEDAIAVSLATDKTLIHRGDFMMIGFPVAKLREYLCKLFKRGIRVAIIDFALDT
jgi:DNA mismatch repair protein MutS